MKEKGTSGMFYLIPPSFRFFFLTNQNNLLFLDKNKNLMVKENLVVLKLRIDR
jgi:hypothetical protein